MILPAEFKVFITKLLENDTDGFFTPFMNITTTYPAFIVENDERVKVFENKLQDTDEDIG
jgi:hypothetical protein